MQKNTVKIIVLCLLAFMSFSVWAQENGLPVIRIDTQNGAGINSKEIYTPISSFSLTDSNNPKYNVSRADINDGIRGRGNSTWGVPQKSYRIKFDKKTSLFGLPAAKSWILLTNWYDPTLLKNAFVFELGRRLKLPYNHSYHHIELYLNGNYNGNYILTEHNQVGEGRVDISETEGWLVEMDFHYDEYPQFRTDNYWLPVMIKSPEFEPANMNNSAYAFVRNDWNQLCDLMASSSFPENGYRELIDMESILNYFLVQVLTQNHDFNHPGSVYWHKDKNGKISAGPLWDFDLSFGIGWRYDNAPIKNWYYLYDGAMPPTTRAYPGYPFFARFFQDPIFRSKWRENWNKNKAAIVSMSQFIDNEADKIRESAKEHYKVWRVSERVDFDYWIEEMKNYLNLRINYLNEQYNSIDIFPASKDFGTANNYGSGMSPQIFTLIAYGEIKNFSASFRRGDLSNFEITGLSQVPMENGEYLTTVSVKPKDYLKKGTYIDQLILSGENQGKSFSQNIRLNFYVNSVSINDINTPQINPLKIWVDDGLLHVGSLTVGEILSIYNATGVLIYQSIVVDNEMTINLPAQGMYIVRSGSNTEKVVVK